MQEGKILCHLEVGHLREGGSGGADRGLGDRTVAEVSDFGGGADLGAPRGEARAEFGGLRGDEDSGASGGEN